MMRNIHLNVYNAFKLMLKVTVFWEHSDKYNRNADRW